MEDYIEKSQEEAYYTQTQTKIIPSHSELLSLVDGKKVYDFGKCVSFLEGKGKENFGDHFKIYNSDYELLLRLLVYVIGDKEGCLAQGLSLKKGILLTGPVGCGKTSIMKLLRFIQPQASRYIVRSCREISFAFIRDGFEVIHQFGHNPSLSAQVFCFDDLGIENSLKYFGNECNVLGEILLSRYETFVSQGTLTHVTTNFNSSEIESFYGNRVRSRMREMFNLISFHKESMDKRS